MIYAKRILPALCCALLLALCGCSAYRGISDSNVVSVRKPVFQITLAAAPANAPAEVATAREPGDQTQSLAPTFSGANLIYAEKVLVLNGGGSAASNEVSPALEIPLVKSAPPALPEVGADDSDLASRTARSHAWHALRDRLIKSKPMCEVCGAKATTEHHKVPVSIDPTRELDPDNCVSLCDRCHLFVGHLGCWRAYNPDFDADAAYWRARVIGRVMGKDCEVSK